MSDVLKMENQPGSLASGYKSTLRALHILLMELDRMERGNQLSKNLALDNAVFGAIVAMKLGATHFPE